MNINIKKILGYLLYTIIFVSPVASFSSLEVYFKQQLGRNPRNYITPAYSFYTIYPMIIGIFAGLPSFISKTKKSGPWKINWYRLAVVGLPFLFIATLYIFYYVYPLEFYYGKNHIYTQKLLQPSIITCAGIMFGYTLISSIDKINDRPENIKLN